MGGAKSEAVKEGADFGRRAGSLTPAEDRPLTNCPSRWQRKPEQPPSSDPLLPA